MHEIDYDDLDGAIHAQDLIRRARRTIEHAQATLAKFEMHADTVDTLVNEVEWDASIEALEYALERLLDATRDGWMRRQVNHEEGTRLYRRVVDGNECYHCGRHQDDVYQYMLVFHDDLETSSVWPGAFCSDHCATTAE